MKIFQFPSLSALYTARALLPQTFSLTNSSNLGTIRKSPASKSLFSLQLWQAVFPPSNFYHITTPNYSTVTLFTNEIKYFKYTCWRISYKRRSLALLILIKLHGMTVGATHWHTDEEGHVNHSLTNGKSGVVYSLNYEHFQDLCISVFT